MRTRIKTQVKVDIASIGMQIKQQQDRKRQVIREVLRYVCNRDNISISQAKIVLRKELMWNCIKREMASIGNDAASVLAS